MDEPTPLGFSLAGLQRELEVLPQLASKFLEDGVHPVREAKARITTARLRPDTDFTWEIPEAAPIRTIVSAGEYERRNSGTQRKGIGVLGALSFKWHLRTGPEKKISDVHLVGNASTKIRILDGTDESELAMWRMEIGGHDAPGCCFHAQVLGTKPEPPFPKSLPVPRLPAFPATPMSCLEFLLSELFQVRWRERVERTDQPVRDWRGLQNKRFESFLKWQLGVVDATNSASPLVRLKHFPQAAQLSL
jgi:hypothetical protein